MKQHLIPVMEQSTFYRPVWIQIHKTPKYDRLLHNTENTTACGHQKWKILVSYFHQWVLSLARKTGWIINLSMDMQEKNDFEKKSPIVLQLFITFFFTAKIQLIICKLRCRQGYLHSHFLKRKILLHLPLESAIGIHLLNILCHRKISTFLTRSPKDKNLGSYAKNNKTTTQLTRKCGSCCRMNIVWTLKLWTFCNSTFLHHVFMF